MDVMGYIPVFDWRYPGRQRRHSSFPSPGETAVQMQPSGQLLESIMRGGGMFEYRKRKRGPSVTDCCALANTTPCPRTVSDVTTGSELKRRIDQEVSHTTKWARD